MTLSETILEVTNLKKHFPIRGGLLLRQVGAIHAVDDVSFDIKREETLGLVGESGCGKTTLGRTILRLIEADAGKVSYMGRDLLKLKSKEMRKVRLEMAMIFQDPYSSLNPRMTAAGIISEPIDIHGLAKGNEKKRRITELVKKVGLAPFHMYRYPHEFSGGQKQRIGIARALASNPKLLVADEPVSSLDVSVRAQILNLLKDLQEELGLAVMYVGKLTELAPSKDIYKNPLHPYTEALLSAIPVPGRKTRKKRIILKGSVPTPIDPPPGCRFNPRCPYKQPTCAKEDPEFIEVEKGHFVACHLRK
jgi:oligopeptide transport system ATP-binding protein